MSAMKAFRVLSLDGGGMRGIYTAQYLNSLADGFSRKRTGKPLDIGSAFDLIVGTSTGAILACAVAAGLPLSTVVDFYLKEGPKIFTRPVPSGSFRLIPRLIADLNSRPKALKEGESALRNALAKCFGKETIGELYQRRKIALGITSVDMSTHRSWVFKTPHLGNSNHRDDPFTLVDVCLASSAAPIYRSPAELTAHDGSPGSHVFADGGLWANNPVLIGMIDALEMAAKDQPIEIFSIGTVPRPAGDDMTKMKAHRGLLDWRFGAEVAALAIDSQEFAYQNMARMLSSHLDHPCTIIRFPRESVPAEMMKYLDLDEVRPAAMREMVNLARNDVNMTNSRCGDANDSEGARISQLFHDMTERAEA